MKKWWIAAGVAAAPFVIASPAWAAASATATLSNLTWTLFDLDPADGITPAITFSGESSFSSANADADYVYESVAGFFAVTAASAMSGSASANASTSGTGASAAASVGRSPAAGTWIDASSQSQPVYGSFTITPWTGILFTADISGMAMTTVGRVGADYEYAGASASISVSVSDGGGYEFHQAYRAAYANFTWSGSAYTGTSESFAGLLRLGYANFSGDAVSGYVSASAATYSASSLPVPEPQTYALMLAGLATLGFWVRRRRRDG